MKSRGIEQDRVGAVLPRRLEAQLHAPIRVHRQPLLRERRPSHVAAKPLEPRAVPTIERHLCMHIDPTDLGDGLGRRGDDAERSNELARALSGGLAEELHVRRRRRVARRERRLFVPQPVGRVLHAVERAAVSREHPHQRRVRPLRHLRDLLAARLRQRVEDELTLTVPDVRPVQRERVEVRIDPQRAVHPLDEGHRADQGVLHAREPELPLGPPAQRPSERPMKPSSTSAQSRRSYASA